MLEHRVTNSEHHEKRSKLREKTYEPHKTTLKLLEINLEIGENILKLYVGTAKHRKF